MGYLGCEHRFSPPERPKGTIGRLLSVAPDIISCETDMLRARRRECATIVGETSTCAHPL